jgi:ABC-2 type transport system permease protein
MSTVVDTASAAPARSAAKRRPTLLDAVRWEAAKLTAQLRARVALALCLVGPILVVAVTNQQQRPPRDSLFGRYIHESGFAVALLILGYASQWLLPLLTAVVAGDIFASEDQRSTWKTVLTRSTSRAQLFWAKTIVALTFATVALIVLAASTIVSSVVIAGHQTVTGLSGQPINSGEALRLVSLSWFTMLAPMIGFTCLAILLSVRSRNPAVGIAAPVAFGLIMQLAGSLGGIGVVRPFLLSTPFETWHGLLAEPHFYGPLLLGLIACAGWSIVCLAAAFISLRHRDISED